MYQPEGDEHFSQEKDFYKITLKPDGSIKNDIRTWEFRCDEKDEYQKWMKSFRNVFDLVQKIREIEKNSDEKNSDGFNEIK